MAVYVHFQALWSEIIDQVGKLVEKQLRRALIAKQRDKWIVTSGRLSDNWGAIYFAKASWMDRYSLTLEAGQLGPDKDDPNVPLSPKHPRYLSAYITGDSREIPGLRPALASLEFQVYKNPRTLWFGKFLAPYDNLTSPEAMLAMYDGSAAKYIVGVLLQLRDIAEPFIDQQLAKGKKR